MVPFDGKYMTSYLMTIVMFGPSVTIYKLSANQINCQKLDLENEDHGQEGEKWDMLQSTANVLIYFYIGDFFIILAPRQHTFTQKWARSNPRWLFVLTFTAIAPAGNPLLDSLLSPFMTCMDDSFKTNSLVP